ncbi:hypothetical protein LEP1GSC051_3434 [Leptospira sp. P2653]|nr:hypothetical protein LEP1GSC051_3434 [Leptospira sp. P2653]
MPLELRKEFGDGCLSTVETKRNFTQSPSMQKNRFKMNFGVFIPIK